MIWTKKGVVEDAADTIIIVVVALVFFFFFSFRFNSVVEASREESVRDLAEFRQVQGDINRLKTKIQEESKDIRSLEQSVAAIELECRNRFTPEECGRYQSTGNACEWDAQLKVCGEKS